MQLTELVARVSGELIVDKSDASIKSVYTGDLLSDIMGHCGDESALITIQNHLNTIAVCSLVGVEAVVICHSRPIPDDMAQAARREGVAVIVTKMSQFEASIALKDLESSSK